jgi:hypothetical protein
MIIYYLFLAKFLRASPMEILFSHTTPVKEKYGCYTFDFGCNFDASGILGYFHLGNIKIETNKNSTLEFKYE